MKAIANAQSIFDALAAENARLRAALRDARAQQPLVQLFYICFVFPKIGIQLSAFEAGVIGLGFAPLFAASEISHLASGRQCDFSRIARHDFSLRRIAASGALTIAYSTLVLSLPVERFYSCGHNGKLSSNKPLYFNRTD